MLIDGKDLCGDKGNLVPLSASDFFSEIRTKASGASSLALMNQLLLYSFREVHFVLWYGGEKGLGDRDHCHALPNEKAM
jgi:hypothetical protein